MSAASKIATQRWSPHCPECGRGDEGGRKVRGESAMGAVVLPAMSLGVMAMTLAQFALIVSKQVRAPQFSSARTLSPLAAAQRVPAPGLHPST